MIFYKWVHKRKHLFKNLYYSIYEMARTASYPTSFKFLKPYRIGKTYKLDKVDSKDCGQCGKGYHLAIEARYSPYFQDLDIVLVNTTGYYINACLECEVNPEDIIFTGEDKVRVRKFKIVKEIDVYCYGKGK